MVLVGAMIVAGIETVWAGQVPPPRAATAAPVRLERGAEMGRFFLGRFASRFSESLIANSCGQRLDFYRIGKEPCGCNGTVEHKGRHARPQSRSAFQSRP